jgi:hypothetical protein
MPNDFRYDVFLSHCFAQSGIFIARSGITEILSTGFSALARSLRTTTANNQIPAVPRFVSIAAVET